MAKRKIRTPEQIRDQFVLYTLRRASLRWPPRNEAMRLARLDRGIYQCNICKDSFGRKEIQLDHIHPAVDLKSPRIDWHSYIERLFPQAEGFQVLCINCHANKTRIEDEMRQYYQNNIDKKK